VSASPIFLLSEEDDRVSAIPTVVRVGAVSYLNAQPLVFDLDRLSSTLTIVEDYPSRLADGLSNGTIDVAIVPSIEFLRGPGRKIVSGACIATNGAVRSVKLFGRVPVERIRSLALDEGSRTSAALTRILLKERFGIVPELQSLPLGASLAESSADAVMLIGDRGMRPPEGDFAFIWDLGEEWTRWTGLPFVFALWVVRPGVEPGDIGRLLATARDRGIESLEEIARNAAPKVGLPESECLAYLRENLTFHLGPQQREGLARFYELAVRHGLAPSGGKIVFHDR